MTQCEKTENQAEHNKSHAVASIEAHPTPPHCRFFRNDRCNLAHADLQRGITWREVWAPERMEGILAAKVLMVIVGALPLPLQPYNDLSALLVMPHILDSIAWIPT